MLSPIQEVTRNLGPRTITPSGSDLREFTDGTSRNGKRERDEDSSSSFLPPKDIEEHQQFSTVEPPFCIVDDDKQDGYGDQIEPALAKRVKHEFQDCDGVVGDHHTTTDDSDPYLALFSFHLPASHLDPEYGEQPWLEQPHVLYQDIDPTYYDTSPFLRLEQDNSIFPTEAISSSTGKALSAVTIDRVNKHGDNSTDKVVTEDESDEKNSATITTNDDVKPEFSASAPDVVSSSALSIEKRGVDEKFQSLWEPSPCELKACNNQRKRHALMVWYQRLSELVEFKKAHGDTNVSQKYAPNPSLGVWVNKQRCHRALLTLEKNAALEAVEFDWGKKKGQHAWNVKFDELVSYRAKQGNCKSTRIIRCSI